VDATRRLAPVGLAIICLFAAACGPEPTPLPVVMVTASPSPEGPTTPVSSPSSTAHYVVDPLAAEFVGVSLSNASGTPVIQIVEMPRLTGDPAEIIIGSQPFEGGQSLPTVFLFGISLHHLEMIDSPELTALLREYLRQLAAEDRDASQLTESRRAIRETLANAGYPDGISVSISHAIQSLFQDLESAGIKPVIDGQDSPQLQVLFSDEQREMLISTQGEDNVIYGFMMPLYYAASADLEIRIGSDGLPAFTGNF